MSGREILESKRADIFRIAAQHGARNVRIFGSVARGDEGPGSDLDFLVEFDQGRSVLDLAAFWQDLENLLKRRVEVAEPEGLHWYIRDKVLKEAVPL